MLEALARGLSSFSSTAFGVEFLLDPLIKPAEGISTSTLAGTKKVANGLHIAVLIHATVGESRS